MRKVRLQRHHLRHEQRPLPPFVAADIQQNLTSILNVYKSYAQGFAELLRHDQARSSLRWSPDWYQYTINQQTEAMTPKHRR